MPNYPADVTKGPFINFKAYETRMSEYTLRHAFRIQKGALLWECNLYAPGSIEDRVGTKWQFENPSMLGNLIEKAKGVFGTVHRTASLVSGKVLAPNEVLLFSGSEPIGVSFTFNMIPKNASEAQAIDEIVGKFKSLCLPKLKGVFFEYPPVWVITVISSGGSVSSDGLVRYDNMALENVSITYTPNSDSQMFFPTGLPVGVRLTLNFQSMLPAFIREIDKAQGTPER